MDTHGASAFHFRVTGVLAGLLLGMAGSAGAENFFVDNNNNEGQGSYRDAVERANLSPGPHKILFEDIPGGVITVREPVPAITRSVELVGLGQTRTVLDGQGSHGVVKILPFSSSTVSLRDLTLRNGSAAIGGCVMAARVLLTIERVRVTGCTADVGGGISADSSSELSIISSRIDHNTAGRGGGLFASSIPVRISFSEIDHNAASTIGFVDGGGAAISGPAHIETSYFHHNTASAGGGLAIYGLGNASIHDSTFFANIANQAAAIYRSGASAEQQITIVGSTFSRNVGRYTLGVFKGSLYLGFSTLTDSRTPDSSTYGQALLALRDVPTYIEGTVLAGNFVGGFGLDLDTQGAPAVASRNYVGRVSVGTLDPASPGTNIFGSTPGLGPLRWQGGMTPTMQPLPDSPLIDSGNLTGTPLRDQRGFKRIVGLATDIGAVEYDPDRISFGYFETDPVEE